MDDPLYQPPRILGNQYRDVKNWDLGFLSPRERAEWFMWRTWPVLRYSRDAIAIGKAVESNIYSTTPPNLFMKG